MKIAMNTLAIAILLILSPSLAFADECMNFAVYICEACSGESEACRAVATTAVTQERAKRVGRTEDARHAGKTCDSMRTTADKMVSETNTAMMCALIENAAKLARADQPKD